MSAASTQASNSPVRLQTRSLDSSQFSQRTRSNTLKNSTSTYYQTPKKSVKPPSLTSISIPQHRKPQVRFARPSEKGKASKFEGRWEEEEDWSDEDSSTLGDDDDDWMRLLERGVDEKRGYGLQIERSYRKRVKKYFSSLRRGSLQSAPVVDCKAFSRVTTLSESTSSNILKYLSEDSANVSKSVLEKYERSAMEHETYLRNDGKKLEELLSRLRKLEGSVEKLRSIHVKLVESKISTNQELTRIHLATQSEISRLEKLWEEAKPQYIAALQAAAGPSARSRSRGKGGNGANGIEQMLISLIGGETREPTESPTSMRGRRRLA